MNTDGIDTEQAEAQNDPFQSSASAVRATPGDANAWNALEDSVASSGEPDALAALYLEVLQSDIPPDAVSDVARRAVNFHEEWFSESAPELVEVLSAVLAIDPSARDWAFQRLTVVHTVAERWDALLSLYDREIERTPDTHRRARLLEEAAQTAKDFASAPAQAAAYLLELFDLRPKDRSLASSLERLLERQERYADLVHLWRRQAELAEPAEAQVLRLRIAESLFDRLDSPGDAIGELSELLKQDGDSDGPTEMLERIVGDERVDREARGQALTILRETYDSAGREADAIGALETAIRFTDGDEKIALHRDVAARLRTSEKFDASMEHLAALLALSPGDEAALDALRELAPDTQHPERLVAVLVRSAEAVEDVEQGARLRLEAVECLARGGEMERAAQEMAAVSQRSDLSETTLRQAVRRHAELLAQMDRQGERLELLEKLAGLEPSRGEKRDAFVAAARLASELGQPDRAIAAWEATLEVDPKDPWSLEEIINILTTEERYADLVATLRRRADSGIPAFQRRQDLGKIADIQASQLEQTSDAIATWNEIGASYGEDAAVVDALVALYAQAERWEDQAALLDRAAARNDAHLAVLRAVQGDTFFAHLGQAEHALSSYRRALQAEAGNEAARRGLASLSEHAECGPAAVDALAQSYESSEEWGSLLALLPERLAACSDTGEKLQLLSQAARLQEEAGAQPAALSSYAQAFALAPERTSFEDQVMRLAEIDYVVAADAYRAAAEACDDAERRGQLRAQEAEFRENQLADQEGELDRAFEAALDGFRARPRRADDAARLLRIATAAGRLGEAEPALITAADHPSAAPSLIARLADLQRARESDKLPVTLRRLVQLEPASLDALVELCTVAPEEEQRDAYEALFERASTLWRRGREASGEAAAPEQCMVAAEWIRDNLSALPAESSAHMAEVSRLPLEAESSASWLRAAARKALEAELPGRAMALFRELLESYPEDQEALEALGDLYKSEGRGPELLDLRRRELALAEDPARRVELRLEVAALVTDIEENGGRLEALEENLREEPGHAPSIDALERYLRARRDFERLGTVFTSQAEQLEGPTAATMWGRAAELFERDLDQLDDALKAHRRVVDFVPDDIKALDSLARIQSDRGQPAVASRWLERRLAVAADDERADVAMVLSAALLDAGRGERACEVLEVARQDAPERDDIRAVLAAEYRKRDNYGPLARVLADSASRAEKREDVLALVTEAATLYRDQLRQPSQAIPVVRRALELAPGDRDLSQMLAEGLRDAEEYDEARSVLEALIEDFGRRRSSERANAHYELGLVARAQGDIPEAIDQLEKASKMAAADPRMLQMLGKLAREAGDLARAEKAYRALLMTVRRQRGEKVDVAAAEVLYELHALARDRGEESQAEELRESALEAASQSDIEALRFRDHLLGRDEDDLLLAALDRRVESALDPSSKALVLAAMGDVLESQDRREEAIWRRMSALEYAPGQASIHAATLTALREAGSVEPYVTKLEEIIEQCRREKDTSLLSSLLVRLGRVKEEDLGDLDAATSLYGRAESLLDFPLEAWVALARLGAARNDVPLQRRVLLELAKVDDLEETLKADCLHQLAAIQLRHVQEIDEAVVTARRAFDLEPRHEELAAHLERAMGRVADTHVEAMHLYEEVARDAGDDAILLTFLIRRAQADGATLPHVKEAIEAARRADSEEALEQLLVKAAAIAAETDAKLAREFYFELSERKTQAGDGQGAIRYAQMAVETAEFDDERRELELQLAKAAAGPGGDLEVAADVYGRLLENDPMDESLWRPLLTVLRTKNDEEKLVALVAQLEDGLLDPELRNVARMERAGWLMETEGREFEAVDILKAVLDEEPNHSDAGTRLAALYEECGYSDDLVALLEQQLDAARDHEDLEQISELTLKLGTLLEKVRREDAMDVYRRALDWVSKDRAIIERYLALFVPDDDAREHASLRESLLRIETGEAASALARELYEEWGRLEDHEAMVRTLALGYAGNPGDDGIRSQLENYYRDAERHEELATFLASDAERLTHDPAGAVQRLREAATIRRDKLADAAGAVTLLQSAYESVGGVEILGELVVALQAAGQQEEAETTITGAIDGHESRDEGLVHLLLSRAKVRSALGHFELASEDLENAYSIAPHMAAGDLVQVLVALRDQAAQNGQAEQQRAAVLRLSAVLMAAGEKEQARDVLAYWVEQTPSDVEALENLRDIELGREDWNGVVNATHRLVFVVEGESQLEAAGLLADAANAAGLPEHARPGLEHVHAAQPEATVINDRLRTLYQGIEAHAELAGLCLREAAALDDAERAYELEREAGRLYLLVADSAAALDALRRARERKPDEHDTTVLLADAYIAAEQFQDAGQLLEDAIGRHTRRRSPQLSELQQRMADLAKSAGDISLEMQWLGAALEADKNNGAVAARLALLAWNQGDADTALTALRAVTLSRTEGPMSRAKAFLMQAQIAHQRGEARRALLWARKARSEDPELEGVDAFLAQLGDG